MIGSVPTTTTAAMEVKLEKRYPLEVDATRAWAVLRDVPATAGCMPGASITEQVDPTHYKGNVRVKIGPANAAINGTIEVLALDETARRVELLGKGADRTGSQASMKLVATIEAAEEPGRSVLVGDAEVNVTGKLAQFGGRMMVQVADLLLAQFADNFRAAAAAQPEGAAAFAGDEPAAGDGATVAAAVDAGADPGSAIAAGQSAQPGAAAALAAAGTTGGLRADEAQGRVPEATSAVAPDPHAARAAAPPPVAAAPVYRAPPQPRQGQSEINGLTLAWALIKGWFARLFGRG